MQALNSKEMKRLFTISAVAAMVAVSCTNLEEEIYSQIPKDTFLSDDANVALYTSDLIPHYRVGDPSRVC